MITFYFLILSFKNEFEKIMHKYTIKYKSWGRFYLQSWGKFYLQSWGRFARVAASVGLVAMLLLQFQE